MQRLEIDIKKKPHGHNVSHSKRRTKRIWKPNMQAKTILVDGKKLKVKVSTNAIRSLKKRGLL
jgi:large subunit ribosomal protein L28